MIGKLPPFLQREVDRSIKDAQGRPMSARPYAPTSPLTNDPKDTYNQDVANIGVFLAERLAVAIDFHDVVRSCINCAHFRENEGEVCTYVNPAARPPARVIAKGCNWHSKEIPF